MPGIRNSPNMRTPKDDAIQLEIGEIPKTGRTEDPRQLALEGLSEAEAGERMEAYRSTVVEITAVRLGQLSDTVAKESPFQALASADGGELALKEDPAKDPELLTLLEKFKKKETVEGLPSLNAPQRERVMGYYKLAKAQAGLPERAVANGVSSMVLGYRAVEDVRQFVKTYAETGRVPKGLPTPNANFLNAAGRFPGADAYLKEELEATKDLDGEIIAILETIKADADKRAADADKRAADGKKQLESLNRILKLLK